MKYRPSMDSNSNSNSYAIRVVRSLPVLFLVAASVVSAAAFLAWGTFHVGLFQHYFRPAKAEFVLDRLFSLSTCFSLFSLLISGACMLMRMALRMETSRSEVFVVLLLFVLFGVNMLFLPAIAAS